MACHEGGLRESAGRIEWLPRRSHQDGRERVRTTRRVELFTQTTDHARPVDAFARFVRD